MAISKIQTGDNVKVISGSYRGHTGRVLSVTRKTDERGRKQVRASVSGVAQIVKYRKPNKQYNVPGSQKMINRTIDISNLMLLDDKGSLSRSKIEEKDGKKYRSYKTTGSQVVKAKADTEDTLKDDVAVPEEKEIKKKATTAKKKSTKKKKED